MIVIASSVSDKSYAEAGSLLSVFLSGLFIFPLGLFFWMVGYPAAGIGACAVGSLSFAYLSRTSAYQIDTDMLNLFFLAMGSFAVYMAERGRPVLWSMLCGLTMYVFWRWYFHSGFTLVFFVLLLYALRKYEIKKILLSLFIYVMFSSPFVFLSSFRNILEFFHKPESLSVAYADVAELTVMPFTDSFGTVTGFWLFAFIGLVLSVLMGRKLVYLLPFYVLGLMSFTGGVRFMMYLAPVCGAGLGWCADKYLKQKPVLGFAIVTAFAVLVFAEPFLGVIPPPVIERSTYDFIKNLKDLEEDAVIASIWDNGFIIEYLTGKRVFADGASQYKKGAMLYAEAMMQTDSHKSAQMLAEAFGDAPVYLLFTPDMDSKIGGLIKTAGYRADVVEGRVVLTSIDNSKNSTPVYLDDTVYFSLDVIGSTDIGCFSEVYATGGGLAVFRLDKECL